MPYRNRNSYRRIGFALVSLLLAAIPVISLPGLLQAADITVAANIVAENPSDGNCSLIEAIKAANTNAAFNECPAGDDNDDTVVLAANQTYVLTTPDNDDGSNGDNGLPGVTGALTIRGNNATIERSSASQFRFLFTDAPLVLENLTLRGGSSPSDGGAIFARSPVTLTGTSFIGNDGNSGGAIYLRGAGIHITDSLFQENTTPQVGAAVFTNRHVTILNSQFLSNTGGFLGGAVSANAGVGSYAPENAVEVIDSLFRNNRATSGGGGAIFTRGPITLTNTSFISNTAESNGGAVNALGPPQITGGEFAGNRSITGTGGAIQSATSVQVAGTAQISATTFFSNTAFRNGGGASIGYPIVVHNARFERNVVQDEYSGGGLHTEAMTMTNSVFQDNVSGYQGGGVEAWHVDIRDSVFEGNSTFSAGGGVYASSGAIIENTRFISNTTGNRDASSGGGGLWVFEAARITGGEFLRNRTDGDGGAIRNEAGVVLSGVAFADNSAQEDGGAVNTDGPSTIQNSTFTRNHAGNFGGGIVAGEPLTLTKSGFFTNTSDSIGGAIALFNSTHMTDVQIIGNQAVARGGGIVAAGALTLTEALVQGNATEDQGGGIAVDSSIDLNRVTFADNYAKFGGGGIYVRAPATFNRLVNALFYDNRADQFGNHLKLLSTIPNVGTGSVDVIHATIATSKVITGSGVYIGGSGSGAVSVQNSIIASNETGIEVGGSIAFNEDYNFFNNGTNLVPGLPLGTNSLTGNPGFINRIARDFRLLPTSAAVDQGTNLGVTDDLEGDTRPLIAGFDMGADEARPCTPVTGVTLSGPDNGFVGSNNGFTAALAPNNATGPVTYVWSPQPASGQGTDTATYNFGTTGAKEVTVQVSSCFGTAGAEDSRSIDIAAACVPLTGVAVTGPDSGFVGENYELTAAPSPNSASGPITYSWSPQPASGQGTNKATYSFGTAGSKNVTVQASNCPGTAGKQASQSIDIAAACVPLTGVAISGPGAGTTNMAYVYQATVTPSDASGPIVYQWSEKSTTGDQATYTWESPGNKEVSVTAANCSGSGTAGDTRTVAVTETDASAEIYLPTVRKE